MKSAFLLPDTRILAVLETRAAVCVPLIIRLQQAPEQAGAQRLHFAPARNALLVVMRGSLGDQPAVEPQSLYEALENHWIEPVTVMDLL